MLTHVTEEISEYWTSLHESRQLALHAAVYTWAAGQTPSGWVLDLGCEYGFGSLLIAQSNPKLRVLGIDLDLIAIQYTQQLSFSARIARVNADASHLPLGSECFSGIYLINLLHLVRDPIRVLSEVQRALKVGGIIVVSIPLPDAGEFIPVLESEIKARFSRVISPQEIDGQIPSFAPQTFLLNQQDSLWIALCQKG